MKKEELVKEFEAFLKSVDASNGYSLMRKDGLLFQFQVVVDESRGSVSHEVMY